MSTVKVSQEEFVKKLQEAVLPVLKESLGKDIADMVKESVAQSSPPWAPPPGGPSIWEEKKRQKNSEGIAMAKVIRAAAAARLAKMPETGALDVLKRWGETDILKAMETAQSKAQAAGDPLAGGFLVPEEFSEDVIEFLRPRSVVRKLGPMVMSMDMGTLRVPRITSGSSGFYVGENTNIPTTDLETGQLTLSWKKLAALIAVSNDLLRTSSPGADQVVRNDLARAMAERENKAFLRDDGTGSAPKGLRHWAAPANVIAANSVVNLSNATVDLGKLILALKNANVPMTKPAWIINPTTEHYLATVRNSDGFFTFRDEVLQGKIWGYPVGVTTEVPANLGTGGNESEIYLVDMDDAIIGESKRLMIDSSMEAAYMQGSEVVSAFSQDQTVVRAIACHDFAMRRGVSVAVLTGVTWGR